MHPQATTSQPSTHISWLEESPLKRGHGLLRPLNCIHTASSHLESQPGPPKTKVPSSSGVPACAPNFLPTWPRASAHREGTSKGSGGTGWGRAYSGGSGGSRKEGGTKHFPLGFFFFIFFFFLFLNPPYSLGGVAFPFLFPLRFVVVVVSILYFTDITRIVYSPSSFLLTAHRITHTYTPTKMLMNPIRRRFRLGPPPSPPPATPLDGEDRRGTRGHLGRPAGSPHPAPPLTSYSNHNLVYYAAILVFADAPT